MKIGQAVALNGFIAPTTQQQGVVAPARGLIGDVAQLVVFEIAKVKGVVERAVAQNTHVGECVDAGELCICPGGCSVCHCSSFAVCAVSHLDGRLGPVVSHSRTISPELLGTIARDVDRIAAAAQVQVNAIAIADGGAVAGAAGDGVGFVQRAIDFFDAAVAVGVAVAQYGSVG